MWDESLYALQNTSNNTATLQGSNTATEWVNVIDMNNYAFALQVHNKINSETSYRSDWLQYGVPEFWTVANKFGDCEDYALAKREALLQAGWDKDKLGLCVCYTQSGEGHCCLWVDTDKGSFILDNNYDFPMKPSELPYKWESMLCDGVWQQLHGFA